MEYIYLLTIRVIEDYENYSPEPEAYKNEAKAKARFKEEVEKAKKDFAGVIEDGFYEEEESEDCYEVYESGRAAANDYVIVLRKLAVK